MHPPDDWITVEVAADVIERSESWVYRAIRDHKLEARPGKNVQNMDIALVRRADVKRLSETHRGHMSPKAFIVSDSGSSGSSSVSANGAGDGTDSSSRAGSSSNVISSKDDITQPDARHKPLLGWREAAWGLAGMNAQLIHESAQLHADLDAEREARRQLIAQMGEERGRRQAAEQRAQAAADEAAALRERAVRAEEAARQVPPRRGWLPWRWGKG